MLNKFKGWLANLLYRLSPLHAILTEAVRVRDNRITELMRELTEARQTPDAHARDLEGRLARAKFDLAGAQTKHNNLLNAIITVNAQLASAEDHAGSLERKVARLLKERETGKRKGKR